MHITWREYVSYTQQASTKQAWSGLVGKILNDAFTDTFIPAHPPKSFVPTPQNWKF